MLDEKLSEGLTFDDVSLLPALSDVLPAEADTRTHFSRRVPLNVPVSSAAMDTVTEAAMAIAIAQQGGIGVIHKNLTIQGQRDEVDKVKRSESGMIVDPVTITPDLPVSDALALMQRYRISGVPVVLGDGKLVGILTNRDLRFETRTNLPVSEIMTRDVTSTWLGTTVECRGTSSTSSKVRAVESPTEICSVFRTSVLVSIHHPMRRGISCISSRCRTGTDRCARPSARRGAPA